MFLDGVYFDIISFGVKYIWSVLIVSTYRRTHRNIVHSSVPSTCPSSDFISQCMPVTYIEMPFIDTIPRNCYTCLKGKFEDIKVVIRSRKHDVWFVFSSSFLYERSCFIYVIAYCGVQHTLCCVFVLFFFVFCALCCQFLWIAHFWLPLRYSLTFIQERIDNTIAKTDLKNHDYVLYCFFFFLVFDLFSLFVFT